ncbi:hypothetical protein [Altererythrobacter sp. MF3-039]|uniref:hypothetical protein n=1 Tax=Altererythrobacter sp. MF3-039 TaxID=3252901 RepID=UPI00390CCD9C
MRRSLLISGAALALCSGLVLAQDAPESLLPPGFDDPEPPAPVTAPAPRPTQAPSSPGQVPSASGGQPVVQPLPDIPDVGGFSLENLPTLEELEEMSIDELDELLGLKPKFDIPPAARRAMERVGIIAADEGGFAPGSLARQPAMLVDAALAGTTGPLVSRWGHIMLRRALASRMAPPEGMSPVRFAALRMSALNAMGEYGAARAIAQDVDTANWDELLTAQAVRAYFATSDILGACPAVRLQGGSADDPEATMLRAICDAYAGEETRGNQQLNRALSREIAPRIDILLAQRYAGAAGQGRRAVDIEWDGVDALTPWRASLANAVGEEIPEGLRDGAADYYLLNWATAPMLGLPQRALGADLAASRGILSASAAIDLYSQIYADDEIIGDVALTSTRLREAYVANDPDDRMSAITDVWGGLDGDYGRFVLTAYAAARMPPGSDYGDDAGGLIAAMLSAGLDRDAALWTDRVSEGSLAWALLAVGRPGQGVTFDNQAVDAFLDDDDSVESRKSKFLVAGLAGLGRIGQGTTDTMVNRLEMDLSTHTRWTRLIDRAADVQNPALVAILAGLGMQGDSWERMTPRYLYRIVNSLRRVGLEAEARMIAAEAVARA